METTAALFDRVLVSPIISGVVNGATTLVPVGRAPLPLKIAMVGGAGIATGVVALLAFRKDVEYTPRDAAIGGAAVGGVLAAATAGVLAVDAAVDRGLQRGGVRHPRWWMAAAGAAFGALWPLAEARAYELRDDVAETDAQD